MRKLVILFILVTWTRSVAVADHDKCNADRAWKLFVCDGNQWQAIKTDDILDNKGSPKNPGKSCDDIKDKRPNAENGIYYITLGEIKDAFPVYCDMVNGGWTMVFKAVTGANQKALEIYKSSGTFNEDQLKALDVTNRFPNDYKNRILLNWEGFGATEARVVLYKGGNSVKELIFNAKGKNYVNWFYINQLKNTPWSDIRRGPFNLFVIDPWPKPGFDRSFIINSVYKGCPGDDGWMVITGRGCGWEQSKPLSAILYSKVDGHTNWNKHENVGIADVLAVFVH